MKKMARIALAALLLVCSACSENKAAHTETTTPAETSVPAETTASEPKITEIADQSEAEETEPEKTPEKEGGFIFQDLTGVSVDPSLVSGYSLNYALGWQPSSGELTRLDRFPEEPQSPIEGMTVTDAKSEYAVLSRGGGSNPSYDVNCCQSEYFLRPADDYFGEITMEVILKRAEDDSGWVVNLIKRDADEYLYNISAYSEERRAQAEAKTLAVVDGKEVRVQPFDFFLSGAEEFEEIQSLDPKSAYMASLTFSSFGFYASAQDASDSPMLIMSASANLTGADSSSIRKISLNEAPAAKSVG